MHGNTKKERDKYYSQNMPKAKRIIRYIGKIIAIDIHATNIQVLQNIAERQPKFKVNWDFVQLVRTANYNHYSEQDIINTALNQGYITKKDLIIKRRK